MHALTPAAPTAVHLPSSAQVDKASLELEARQLVEYAAKLQVGTGAFCCALLIRGQLCACNLVNCTVPGCAYHLRFH